MFVCFAGLPHFSTNVLSKAIVECVGPIRKKLFQVNKFQKWYFVSKIVPTYLLREKIVIVIENGILLP